MDSKSNTNRNCVLLSEKDTSVDSPNKLTFSELIKEMRGNIDSPSWKPRLSTRELAEMLDVNYELFRKIVNMNKPTKNRDCIIAICAALEMNSEETDTALIAYNYMPTLDAKNPRDDTLIEILENQKSSHLTIPQINRRLSRSGFPKLAIVNHRNNSIKASERNGTQYKIVRKRLRTISTEYSFGDPFNSLSTEYNTDRYHCIAEMWLDDPKAKTRYHLFAEPNKDYHMNCFKSDSQECPISKSYAAPDGTGEFEDYFLELDAMINREKKKYLSILNDTKNYITRRSAKIHNDSLYVFAETYNYTIPELNEYYLYEYQDGKSSLSVFSKSEFMHSYLSEDEYAATYGKRNNTLIAKYDTIESIYASTNQGSKCPPKYQAQIFSKLKEYTESLALDIKNRKKYIRNLAYIYEDKDRVCQFFGVEKEFGCEWEGPFQDIMHATTDSASFTSAEFGTVNITRDDLYLAFELGLNSISEICRIKQRLGSISAILQ